MGRSRNDHASHAWIATANVRSIGDGSFPKLKPRPDAASLEFGPGVLPGLADCLMGARETSLQGLGCLFTGRSEETSRFRVARRPEALPRPHDRVRARSRRFGGCEGIAMINRSNLTLSARSLSHRLNLGTRSLALQSRVNRGDHRSRVRVADHGVMCAGMEWYDGVPPAISISERVGLPAIPGSPVPARPGVEGRFCERPGPFAVFEAPGGYPGAFASRKPRGTSGSPRGARKAARGPAPTAFAELVGN